MAPREHWMSDVKDELAAYVQDSIDTCVEALLDDGRAPFAHPMTRAEQVAYYDRLVFLPDGALNVEGVQQLRTTLRPTMLLQVLKAVTKQRAQPVEAAEPAQEGATY